MNTRGWSISHAKLGDEAAISTHFREIVGTMDCVPAVSKESMIKTFDQKKIFEYIAIDDDRFIFAAKTRDGKIVGSTFGCFFDSDIYYETFNRHADGKVAWISWIGRSSAPEFNGVGTALMNRVIETAAANHVESVECAVHLKNKKSYTAMEHWGFERAGRGLLLGTQAQYHYRRALPAPGMDMTAL